MTVHETDAAVNGCELMLFVSGASETSAHAIVMARRLCDVHGGGQYLLTVVDVHEDPTAALAYGVIATPTLIKRLPLPIRRLVGDLSDTARVLDVLGLRVGGEVNGDAGAVPSAAG